MVAVRDVVDAAEGAMPPGMTLGVAVLDVDTGELVEGRLGGRQFMAASLSKLIVVVDMFDRRRSEGREIAEADLKLVDRALSSSDDGAMSALWGRYDGLGAVRRVAGQLGLTATRPPDDHGEWGDTTTTAGDIVRIYQHILRDMAAADRDAVVAALAAAQPVATDGFAQYYGLLGPGPSAQRYAKQAWVPWAPAGHLLHSAGVVHDTRTGHTYAMALLSIQPRTSAQAARDRLTAVAAPAMGLLGAGSTGGTR